MIGTFLAKACGDVVIGESKAKQTPFIEFAFELTGEEHKGKRVLYTGYFAEKTAERTIEALRTCGWKGNSLTDFSSGSLCGLDTNEVNLVLDEESYVKQDGSTGVKTIVRFVNSKNGSFVRPEMRLSASALTALDAKFGTLLGAKKSNGASVKSDDEVPF